MLNFFQHVLWHPLGFCAGSKSAIHACQSYNFWSGIGSDLSEIVLIGALVAWWRRHNCARHGCWRLSFHPHPEHDVPVCRKHHPKGTL